MAHRQSMPKQQKTFAANAAFLVTAAILSAPAFAATTGSIPCGDLSEATLEVSTSALIAEVVSHDMVASTKAPATEPVSSASLLAPRAAAAIRDAFKENDRVSALPMVEAKSKSHTTVSSDVRTLPIRDMNTKLPGVSDVASSRFKKQMFRRDI